MRHRIAHNSLKVTGIGKDESPEFPGISSHVVKPKNIRLGLQLRSSRSGRVPDGRININNSLTMADSIDAVEDERLRPSLPHCRLPAPRLKLRRLHSVVSQPRNRNVSLGPIYHSRLKQSDWAKSARQSCAPGNRARSIGRSRNENLLQR
jgi:hypothetical protein